MGSNLNLNKVKHRIIHPHGGVPPKGSSSPDKLSRNKGQMPMPTIHSMKSQETPIQAPTSSDKYTPFLTSAEPSTIKPKHPLELMALDSDVQNHAFEHANPHQKFMPPQHQVRMPKKKPELRALHSQLEEITSRRAFAESKRGPPGMLSLIHI